MLSVLLSSNDPRARFLLNELPRYVEVVGVEDFEDIDPITKYAAAALGFRWSRRAWWRAYQMHPLVQIGRRRVLQKAMRRYRGQIDALLMWGSWFHPTKGADHSVPFFQYIDESMSPPAACATTIPGFTQRKSFHMQAETYAACSGILCMSAWARDQTLAGFPECADKLHVVGWGPCGVDLSNEDIDENVRRPMVLHVSNDFERKGVDFLIRTAEVVRATLPQTEFVVIGQAHHDVPIRSDAVRFLGPIRDKQELAWYFRQASLFFLPHRFDRSPHVLVEAMSAGLPLVTSRQGGCIELVEGQGTGWLIPIGDVEGYTHAILNLLTDFQLRARMGAAARDLMRRKYTWDRIAQQMVEVMTRRIGAPV